jgi:endonuclease/exonuclease/phosphatase family metal-dependent hydrolase
MKNILKKIGFLLVVWVIFQMTAVASFPEGSGNPVKLKVLCYNLRFGELASLEELAAFIKDVDPDIVALQEVDVKTYREAAKKQNGKDFITELGYHTGMLTAYARTIDYAGGYYGIGILSKYPFSHTRKVMLPIPDGSKEQRALLIADVELPEGKLFTFVSTHLDHSSTAVRQVQVKAINAALKGNRYPMIVAGDFNAKPESVEISAGMKKWEMACSPDFTIPSVNPKSKIDYIFYAPANRWRKVNAETPKMTLSDHLPLWAEVELLF